MNIFYIDKDPRVCAEQMVDKHVVKMILETAQLLSTAHRLLDGEEYIENKYVTGSLPPRYRKTKRWRLPDDRDTILYSATHINHPSAVWCRQNRSNYEWLFAHFLYLCKEYTYRYNNKIHKCEMNDLFVDRLSHFPTNLPYGDFTPVTPAMAAEYIISDDSMTNYRNYYRLGKIHLHKWTKRQPPEWLAA